MTAEDVLHNWAMALFGIKMDTVPGRINETWFRVPKEKIGVYRGQCSELCGVRHGFMPIVVEVVSKKITRGGLLRQKASLPMHLNPQKWLKTSSNSLNNRSSEFDRGNAS